MIDHIKLNIKICNTHYFKIVPEFNVSNPFVKKASLNLSCRSRNRWKELKENDHSVVKCSILPVFSNVVVYSIGFLIYPNLHTPISIIHQEQIRNEFKDKQIMG